MLIVEDGTGRADAESYVSVAFADSYHTARGRETTWTDLDTDVKEQALRMATDYMGQAYRVRWAGCRRTDTQALDWPRYDAPKPDAPGGYGPWPAYYDDDIVPTEVQRACAELAFRHATGTDLAPDLDPPVTREKVGPIEVEYAQGDRQTVKFQAIDMLLGPLLKSGGASNVAKVVRS